MKRLFVLLVIISFLLCGCQIKGDNVSNSASDIKIVLPDDDTVNGYRKTQSELTDSSDDTASTASSVENNGFYVNTKTMKFHKPNCVYAQKGSENGIWRDADYEQLVNEGLIPCKKCKP